MPDRLMTATDGSLATNGMKRFMLGDVECGHRREQGAGVTNAAIGRALSLNALVAASDAGAHLATR